MIPHDALEFAQVCQLGYKSWVQPSMSSACWSLPASFRSRWLTDATCQETGMRFCSHPLEYHRSHSAPYQAALLLIFKCRKRLQHAEPYMLCIR